MDSHGRNAAERALLRRSITPRGSLLDVENHDLTASEIKLLIDALDDDVSLVWALIDLEIRQNPPATPENPATTDIDESFASLARLVTPPSASRSPERTGGLCLPAVTHNRPDGK